MLPTHRPAPPAQAPVPGWRRLLAAPLTDLRIGLRLGIAFGGVFILMAAMAVFATMNLALSNQRMTHIVEGNSRQSVLVSQMIDSVAQRSIAIRNLALLSDPALKDAERQTIAAAAQDYAAAEKELLYQGKGLPERYKNAYESK